MEPKETSASLKTWTKKLQSEDETLVKKTIHDLRDKGSKDIIPVLGVLLHSNPSEDISNSVINFFRDLKNKESVPAFVEVIKKSKDLEAFSALISCAWENGLDYSEHIEFFINLVVEEELMSAIEAFTVVEENIEKINAEKRNIFINNIAQKSKSVSKEKDKLLKELISIIDFAPGPFSVDDPE